MMQQIQLTKQKTRCSGNKQKLPRGHIGRSGEAVEKHVKACFVKIGPLRIRINTCCIDGSAGSNRRASYKQSRTQSQCKFEYAPRGALHGVEFEISVGFTFFGVDDIAGSKYPEAAASTVTVVCSAR